MLRLQVRASGGSFDSKYSCAYQLYRGEDHAVGSGDLNRTPAIPGSGSELACSQNAHCKLRMSELIYEEERAWHWTVKYRVFCVSTHGPSVARCGR